MWLRSHMIALIRPLKIGVSCNKLMQMLKGTFWFYHNWSFVIIIFSFGLDFSCFPRSNFINLYGKNSHAATSAHRSILPAYGIVERGQIQNVSNQKNIWSAARIVRWDNNLHVAQRTWFFFVKYASTTTYKYRMSQTPDPRPQTPDPLPCTTFMLLRYFTISCGWSVIRHTLECSDCTILCYTSLGRTFERTDYINVDI